MSTRISWPLSSSKDDTEIFNYLNEIVKERNIDYKMMYEYHSTDMVLEFVHADDALAFRLKFNL